MKLSSSYSWDSMTKIGLPWLSAQIEKHSNIPQGCFDPITKEPWDYRLWIYWAAMKGFVFLYPDPPTLGLIARPVSVDLLDDVPKGQELYAYDSGGEGVYMDFLWAPGQIETVIQFLLQTGKTWGAWEHRNTGKVHTIPIASLRKISFHTNNRLKLGVELVPTNPDIPKNM
jgi:hypothetical protein